MTNEWMKPEHATAYLARMNSIPHRAEGESTLLTEIPKQTKRVLALGCGNGHLLSFVLTHCPEATGVGLDFSPTMLEQARDRFEGDDRVTFVEHNMDGTLPALGSFDCVISSFAIHHCTHIKRTMLHCKASTDQARLHKLLKYGLDTHYWNEFVFKAYCNHRQDAVFLTGIPDMEATLPHA